MACEVKHKVQRVGGGRYSYEHRVVWEEAYGPIPEGLIIDHKNGDVRDNSLDNLRLVTYSQNSMNSKISSRNTSGLKGLSYQHRKDRPNGRWCGRVVSNGTTHRFFSQDLLEVSAWIFRTRAELHGEFARYK